MKKINFLLILGILCLISLTSCQKELPPTPPPIGQGAEIGSAIYGLAVGMPTWAAEPKGITLAPTQVQYGDIIVTTVSDYDYVYSKAYYFDSIMREWRPFYLSGEKQKDWIKGLAISSFPVKEAEFKQGDNFIITYGCNKVADQWSCNGQRWMLAKFKIKTKEEQIPGITGAEKYVINSDITAFALRNTGGGADDFEGVRCTRYDAHYRDPSTGLLVVTHVFNFKTQQEIDDTVNGVFKDVFIQGYQDYQGNGVGLFLDLENRRVAVWPSGLNLVYIETYTSEFAAKEVVEAYLSKYPSSLKR